MLKNKLDYYGDFTVYFLRIKNTDTIFYVGITHATIQHRLRIHLTESRHHFKANYPTEKELILLNNDCEIVEIEKVNTKFTALEREVFWINEYRKLGFKLKNLESGRHGAKLRKQISQSALNTTQ